MLVYQRVVPNSYQLVQDFATIHSVVYGRHIEHGMKTNQLTDHKSPINPYFGSMNHLHLHFCCLDSLDFLALKHQ